MELSKVAIEEGFKEFARDEIVEIMFTRYHGPLSRAKSCIRELYKSYHESWKKKRSAEETKKLIEQILAKYARLYRDRIEETIRQSFES
jgi:GTP1/Obg family GTP-binding protein